MNVKPIQKSSATTKVIEALYEMIVTGRYQQGERLPPQDELARQLGVSRNTLREALNQLSAMGMLKSRQGVGTVVEPPGPNGFLATLSSQFLMDPLSVREFIEARICIERTAVRLAVDRALEEDVLQLKSILERQSRAIAARDIVEFTKLDAAFHLELTRICGNRVLMKFLQTIYDMLQRFIGEVSQLPGAMEDALRFHRLVTEGLAAKDKDLAEKEMALHLFDVVRRIESNLRVDLKAESMCGFNLFRSAPNTDKGSLNS